MWTMIWKILLSFRNKSEGPNIYCMTYVASMNVIHNFFSPCWKMGIWAIRRKGCQLTILKNNNFNNVYNIVFFTGKF
jgi:hypothetical protein